MEDIPARVAPSITDRVPLIGADGYFALVNQSEHLGQRYGLHPHRIRHLLDRYGSLLHGLLAMSEEDPTLLEPVPGSPDYLKVEVAYAVAYEGALHLDDVLTRRTRISIEYAHRGAESAPSVGEQMAALLGWDDETRDREVRSYIERVEAERALADRRHRQGGRQAPGRRTRPPRRPARGARHGLSASGRRTSPGAPCGVTGGWSAPLARLRRRRASGARGGLRLAS